MALGCRMSNGIMDRVIDGVQQQRGAPLGPPGMQGVGPGRGGGSAPEGGGGLLADSGELDYQPVSAWR